MKKFGHIAVFSVITLLILMSMPQVAASQNFGNNSIETLSKNSVSAHPLYHNPIIIIGNGNFTAENGVIGGSGTVDDPYIIANWVIRANASEPYGNGTVGIFIANTTKYFIIRNVTVFGGNRGIYLDNVTNFVIEGSRFYNITNYTVIVKGKNGIVQDSEAWDSDGFLRVEGSNITIKNNYVHDMKVKSGSSSVGIRVAASNVTIVNNTIERLRGFGEESLIDGILVYAPSDYALGKSLRNIRILNNRIFNITNATLGGGIVIYSAEKGNISGVLVKDNVLRETGEDGIDIDVCENEGKIADVTVEGNMVSNTAEYSIYVHCMHGNITIRNNILTNSSEQGIFIESSSNVSVSGNYIHDNWGAGVYVVNSTLIEVVGNKISNVGEDGIYLYFSSRVKMENSEISTAWNGIELRYSSSDIIRDNLIHNNRNRGIYIWDTSNGNIIEGNRVYANNDIGLSLDSNNNTVLDNNIYDNKGYGIAFEDSNGNKIIENELWNNSIGIAFWNSTRVFIEGNRVHDNNVTGIVVGDNSKATIISNIVFNNTGSGIEAWDGSYLTIINSTVSGNSWRGIEFYNGGHGVIKSSTVFNNTEYGIYLTDTSNVSVENSNISGNNGYGLKLDHTNNVIVLKSIFESNYDRGILIYNSSNVQVDSSLIIHNNIGHEDFGGIRLEKSSNSKITRNIFRDNRIGLILSSSSDNEVRDNEFFRDGVFVWRVSNNTLKNNTINGKSLLYYENAQNTVINGSDVGQLILVNPINVTVTDLNISNVWVGVEVVNGHNDSILDSYFKNTQGGIILIHSHDILVRSNIMAKNSGIELNDVSNSTILNNYINGMDSGIALDDGSMRNVITNNTLVDPKVPVLMFMNHSDDNEVYLNKINGTVYTDNSTEIWNSPTPVEYLYNNRTFVGYLGNYWSDYCGIDVNGDGIGDSPYVIDSNNVDKHPLIATPDKYSLAELRLVQTTSSSHTATATTSTISSQPLNSSTMATTITKSQRSTSPQNSKNNTENKGICGPGSFLLLAILILLKKIRF